MKELNTYIIEKLQLNKNSEAKESNINLLSISKLSDLELSDNKKVISRYLKGKDHKSALNVYLLDTEKFIHIFRYSDMHHLELSLIYNDTIDWPDENGWSSKNKIEYNDLDDRDNMNNLFNSFYNFLKENIK